MSDGLNEWIFQILYLCQKLGLKVYKKYSEIYSNIEIEIIISQQSYGKFINIKGNKKLFYHTHFNNDKNEIKNKY